MVKAKVEIKEEVAIEKKPDPKPKIELLKKILDKANTSEIISTNPLLTQVRSYW